jgi:hypothetical protein
VRVVTRSKNTKERELEKPEQQNQTAKMRSQVEICHGHARIDSRGRYRLSVVIGDVYIERERKKGSINRLDVSI